MKYRQITAFLLASGFSLSAFAGPGDRIMEHLDTDGDNMITLEEFQPPGRRGDRMLEKIDANGDGAVSLEEMQSARAEREARATERMAERADEMDSRFVEIDTDGDGLVTRDEMRLHQFSRMDENGDGVLTADEIKPRRGMHGRGMRGGRRGFDG